MKGGFFRAMTTASVAIAASLLAGNVLARRAAERGEIADVVHRATPAAALSQAMLAAMPLARSARGLTPAHRPRCNKRGGPGKARRGLNYWRRK